jgi:hypothetical protein
MMMQSWTDLRQHLHGIGKQISTPAGRKILEDEPALDRLLEKVRELSADHPGGWGAFREGAMEGLLRLAINQDCKLDVRPLVRLGIGSPGDTPARRSWWKILGRDLYLALDELAHQYQSWQRSFLVDMTHRADPAKIAEN